MLKKRKITYSLVAAILFTSSIGYADGFNYRVLKYNRNNSINTTRINWDTNYGNNSYNQSNLWNIIISDYNNYDRPGQVITWPTRPVEQEVPVKPTKPVEPAKPVEPTNPTKPVEEEKPVTPEEPTQDYSNLSQQEAEVVRLVNIERQKAGLAPLKASSQLSNVARMKSKDMADKNYFSHTSPTYGSPFDMMKQFGISYRTAGENIAKGYLSPASVMNGWMNSSGHRANILNGSFGTIGVGAYTVGGTTYWTQMFTN